MTFDEAFLDRAHRFSTRNLEDAKRSRECGCFSCLAVFSGSEVATSDTEVPDYYAEIDGIDRTDDQTAVCPRCGLDSVLPGSSDLPVASEAFLGAMRSRWIWQVKKAG